MLLAAAYRCPVGLIRSLAGLSQPWMSGARGRQRSPLLAPGDPRPWICNPAGKSLSTTINNFPDIYQDEYTRSIQDPEGYWGNISKNTVWTKHWGKVLDDSNSPFTKWFIGGQLSLCYNAVDRHVDEGRGDAVALIWDSPITGNKASLTYKELKVQASKVARVLSQMGIGKGDIVIIYMPMVPEAIVSMLAACRLGAIHSVVFGGFSSNELAKRIRHSKAKAIICSSCGVEPSRVIEYKPIVEEALKLAQAQHLPVLVHQRPGLVQSQVNPSTDVVWHEAVEAAEGHDCVEVEANHPLYLLYTSGTTGDPKGVLHLTGSHAVVNKWTMEAIYGMRQGDIWWAASDMGWTVGHGYICYSPLLAGVTSIMYEGKPVGTPDAGQFFRVISDHGVNALFCAPTAVRAIRGVDPDAQQGKAYDISSLRYMFLAGEFCDNETMKWAQGHFKVPTLNHWWQTETAHAITATCVGLGNSLDPPPHSTGKPVPGFDVRVVGLDREELEPGKFGSIVCKLPLAPGTFSTLYEADQKFQDTYFKDYPGFYNTMDAGTVDKDGFVSVLARVDDVINVAGHRISTTSLEEVLIDHPDVVDAVVVGVPDNLKGQVPLGLYVVRKGSSKATEELEKELVQKVRDQVGPVAFFRKLAKVNALPRTRSGKLPRKSIAELASGKQVKLSPTIEDPAVYQDIRKALESLGYSTVDVVVS